MPHLILVRHGQSQWNLENRFTGWVDVDLSDQGREEARRAGSLIRSEGLAPAAAYTSRLKRAIRTLWLILEELDRMWLDYTCSWRLNERHYGALQGLNKAETAAKHGDEQVHIWRRSFDVPPPPLDRDDPMHPRLDPRYASVDPELLPSGESLKDTLARLMPFWHEVLGPRLAMGGDVLVAAHGNSLRAVVKHLEGVPDHEIPLVEIPTGNPLVYELGPGGEVLGRRYLDPGRAAPLPGEAA